VRDGRDAVHSRVAAPSEVLAVSLHFDVGQPVVDRSVTPHHGRRRHRPAPGRDGAPGRFGGVIGRVARRVLGPVDKE